MEKREVIRWLRETDESRLDALYRRADGVRRRNVGDAVHLRGLIESPTAASGTAPTAASAPGTVPSGAIA